ncbi:MAG: MGMT family protein [Elusimicrobiota bacterium]
MTKSKIPRAGQFLIKKIKNSNYPEFYKKVWLECLKIKMGQMSYYSEIAIRIGHPKSARAVGNALGKNPFAPDVPCHRVIRKTGGIGGYSGGVNKKNKLLKEEKLRIIKRQKNIIKL